MNNKFHTLVIGGGCLGVACALSVQRKLGNKAGKVAILEKKVLGAGLSSRHSAIVRSANASPMAARIAKLTTQHWKNLQPIWSVEIPFEQSGAIWIAENNQGGIDHPCGLAAGLCGQFSSECQRHPGILADYR